MSSYTKALKKVNGLADSMRQLTDTQLQHKTVEFKERLKKGEKLEDITAEAFATIREASRRVLGLFAYDEQVIGGLILNEGKLAEMKTGEGKTLVATMPLYLHALTGKSTMLVTSNDYLAVRDAEEMGQVYEFLGLTVGIGVARDGETLEVEDKQRIYGSDIVYTTYGGLTFDYLAENLSARKEDRYLREFYYVLIDEVDDVLLDGAQMPLVISGAPRAQSNLYATADYFVSILERDVDYEMDEDETDVWLTDEGIDHAKSFFNINDLYKDPYYDLTRHIILALKAHLLFKKDEDYVVEDGEVQLISKSTGRFIKGTKLRGGQHQAIEQKEHVELSLENRSMASITYQAFFKMFPILSGMSGVLHTDVKEFKKVYDLEVVPVKTHVPIQRIDLPDSIYTTREAQLADSLQWVLEYHAKGQPILIITDSIGTSYDYSQMLLEEGIPHNVLNAYNLAKEAEIIAEAGQRGNVTVATTMAGRGTDIRLGEGINEIGGMVVLIVGMMNSLRQEYQARGRSGRQGDNGITKCFISFDDELIQNLGNDFLFKMQTENAEVNSRRVRREIKRIRNTSEEKARGQRKDTTDFDLSLSEQRDIIYKMRDKILDQEAFNRNEIIELAVSEAQKQMNSKHTIRMIERYISDNVQYEFRHFEHGRLKPSKKSMTKQVREIVESQLKKQESKIVGQKNIEQFYRTCMLRGIDEMWVEEVDYLQQLRNVMATRKSSSSTGINVYHQEAYRSFTRLIEQANGTMVKNILLSIISYDKEGNINIILP